MLQISVNSIPVLLWLYYQWRMNPHFICGFKPRRSGTITRATIQAIFLQQNVSQKSCHSDYMFTQVFRHSATVAKSSPLLSRKRTLSDWCKMVHIACVCVTNSGTVEPRGDSAATTTWLKLLHTTWSDTDAELCDRSHLAEMRCLDVCRLFQWVTKMAFLWAIFIFNKHGIWSMSINRGQGTQASGAGLSENKMISLIYHWFQASKRLQFDRYWVFGVLEASTCSQLQMCSLNCLRMYGLLFSEWGRGRSHYRLSPDTSH